MKKTYNNPEIEMLAISTKDVIASSGDIEEMLGGDIGVDAEQIF